ncbi:MAG: HlyD family efflux transporter periplasmic adaptor subunit [Gemmataceae bacterium]
MKRLLLIAGLLVVAGGLLWWFWPFGGTGAMRLSGVVEIQEVRLASESGGRIYEILVNEGDVVKPGQPLVILSAPERVAQRDQWQAKLKSAIIELERAESGSRVSELEGARAAEATAKARWDRVEIGWRPEEKDQAKAELEIAVAEKKQAEEDYTRAEELYKMRSTAKAEYDQALAARDRARGKYESARAKKIMMVDVGSREEDKREAKADYDKARSKVSELEASRQEEIHMAKAKVDETRARLAEAQFYVDETTVVSPPKLGTARIEVLAVRPGDVVAANQPLIRVLRLDDWWVKVFVPETKLGNVKDGMEVEVFTDTDPGKAFRGKVIQIANIAEFTPRNVQSLDERRHQVFAVKILVLNPEGRFHAGMAAEVLVPPR